MEQAKRKQVCWDSRSIRALRNHLGMTQQELADELGMRQQTISEWETGMYRPRGGTVTLLTMIAERANFEYESSAQGEPSSDDVLYRNEGTKPSK